MVQFANRAKKNHYHTLKSHNTKERSPRRRHTPLAPLSLRAPGIQAKLTVNQPGDKYEVEANRMANRIVSGSKETAVQTKTYTEDVQQKPIAAGITPLVQKMAGPEEASVQRMGQVEEGIQTQPDENSIQMMEGDEETIQQQCEACSQQETGLQKMEEEEAVQTKSKAGVSEISAHTETGIKSRQGKGRMMDAQTKAEMEQGFGADFSHVNIHTDSSAVRMSEDMHAQAFTVGNDIFFNRSKYDPTSSKGKRLLAHELTHTIQQKGRVYKQESTEAKESDNFKQLKRPTQKQLLSKRKGINSSSFDKKMDCGNLARTLATKMIRLNNKIKITRNQARQGAVEELHNKHLKDLKPERRYQKEINKIEKELNGFREKYEKTKKQLDSYKETKDTDIALIDIVIKFLNLNEKIENLENKLEKANQGLEEARNNKRFCSKARELGYKRPPEIDKSGNMKFPVLKEKDGKIEIKEKTVKLEIGMMIYTAEICDAENTWNNQHMWTYAGNGKVIDRIHPEPGERVHPRKLEDVYARNRKRGFFIVLKTIDYYTQKTQE
ncbi:MAG: DUF4157 domain-containing protein [Cyanobacteria bacterium J06639_14]